MARASPITIGSRTFPTQAAAIVAVRAIVAAHPKWVEFESELLSDLAAEHHYHFSVVGLRPTRFRKVTDPRFPGESNYELQGFFPTAPTAPGEPVIGWRDWSWKDCLKARTPWQKVEDYLRRLVQPRIDADREKQCRNCGVSGFKVRLEVDHVEPTVEAMLRQVRPLITDREILSHRDWAGKARFTLPETHPVVVAFLALHDKAQLQTLCRPCHREVTRRRKIAG